MRILIIWLLFSLPLGITTVIYASKALQPNEPQDASDPDSNSSPADQGVEVLSNLNMEQLEQLADVPIFRLPNRDEKLLTFSSTKKNDQLEEVVKSANTVLKVNRGLRALKQLNPEHSEPQESLKNIEGFLKSRNSSSSISPELFSLYELRGIQPVVSALSEEVEKIQTLIESEESRKRAHEIFQMAKQDMSPGSFDDCLLTLNKIPQPYFSEADTQLKQQAMFWSHWSQLGDIAKFNIAATSSSIGKQLSLFNSVLETGPLPVDSEARKYTLWAQETQKTLSIQLKITQFEERSISNPSLFLEEAEKLIVLDPDVRRQLQTGFRDLIEDRIRKKAINSTGIKEAVMISDNSIKRGYFEISLDGRYYKIWPEDRGGKTGRYTELYLDKLKSKALDSFPNRSASDFNNAREKLMEELTNQGMWENLLQLCEQHTNELQQYKQQTGSENTKLDYSNDSSFCKQIIDNWKLFEVLMQQ